ncbi:MAG: hypothetical protein KGJ89_04955, partial [Patescibacteria group bacterium]|nr:hypothetical protein [Patescibacteria group bacterium]MDE2015534.1 hypothetical protein [Patescibacteria group bacterium]MDE2227270.1 hypothetical protein [Patescibacteria group bacterium]
GDSSPSTKLEVAGNVSSTGLCLGGTCNTAWPNSSQWTTSGSNIYYSTGNVSVGTSTTNVAAFQVNAPAKHGLYVSGNSSANVVHDIYIHRDSSGTGIATGPNIRFEDGTANDNIVIQNSQGNLTFWNYGAGSWQEKMRMDSSGNLGIGMTPTHKLDVLGDILASRGDGSGAIYFGSSGGYVIGGTGGSMQVTAGGTNQNITLAPSGTGYTLLNGNVGVGTTAPGAKLNLLGGSLLVGTTTLANAVYTIQNGDGSADTRALFASSNPWSIKVQQGAGNGGYYVGATAAAAPDLIFSNQAGTERMRITDAGNVGIGTTGPSAALDVRGYAMFARGNSIQFADAGGLNRRNLARFLTTADTIVFGDTDNSGQAPVNFVFMPNTGGVGIGTSTPAYPLHVYSTSTAYILADFQSSNANGANIALSQTGTANGNKYIRSQGGNLDVINNAYTAAILSVSDAGNLTVGSGGTGSLNVGNVTLKGATSNTIFYGTVGVAAPGAGSAGEKIQLYGTAGTIGAADYALGIQGSNMWLNSGGGYVWYYNSTTIMSLSTAGTLTVGNGGVGKVTAGTFDPVYTIGGKNYATYLPGMTGVKEETTGVADLACSGGTCFYSINFSKLEKGSDLWLFWQATDFGKNMENLVALLTPSFDGRVWYQKDAAANILTIFGSSAGEVSYRLTANRFDSAQWPNASADSAAGLTPPEK